MVRKLWRSGGGIRMLVEVVVVVVVINEIFIKIKIITIIAMVLEE